MDGYPFTMLAHLELAGYKGAVAPVLDRGLLFAVGVYEISGVVHNPTTDNEGHLKRLGRSLVTLNVPAPRWRADLDLVYGVGSQSDQRRAVVQVTTDAPVATRPRRLLQVEPARSTAACVRTSRVVSGCTGTDLALQCVPDPRTFDRSLMQL